MKRLLLIIPFLLLYSSVDAQLFKVFGHDVGFIYVGPRVGMSMSKISNWTVAGGLENKSKYGYQFGVVGEFGITSRFSFETELNFLSRGMRQTDGDITSKIKVNYIGIPLLAKYSFSFLGLKKVYVKGGTYQDVRTGGEFVYESPAFSDTQPLDNAGWTRMDWGLVIGAGAEYPVDYGIWGLDLRYGIGLVDVHKSDAPSNRNQSFNTTLTFKFDLVDIFFKMKKKSNNNDTETVEGENKIKGLKVEERN